jgi:hypothetical protein
MMKFLFIISLSLYLFGCASFKSSDLAEGPAFKSLPVTKDDHATLILFRYAGGSSDNTSPSVFIDSLKVGQLNAGGYISIYIKPGDHKLSVKKDDVIWQFKKLGGNISVKPKRLYLIELSVSNSHDNKIVALLNSIDSRFSEDRLKDLKHINYK